jgi:hypothetical protein
MTGASNPSGVIATAESCWFIQSLGKKQGAYRHGLRHRIAHRRTVDIEQRDLVGSRLDHKRALAAYPIMSNDSVQ